MAFHSTGTLLLAVLYVIFLCLAMLLPRDVTIVLFAIVLGLAGVSSLFRNAPTLTRERHIGLALTLLGIGLTVWWNSTVCSRMPSASPIGLFAKP